MMNIRIARFVPAVCWLLLSFYLLTMPGSELPKVSWFDRMQGDKLAHIGIFGILVLLYLLPWRARWNKGSAIRIAMIIAGIALLYGIAMEFVQKYWVANRSFDIGDIFADAIGSFLPLIWIWKKQTATDKP